MMFLLVFILLLVCLLIYFRIADHFNIIDKPNNRSSHTAVTIRGGGIVFPLAMVLYVLFFRDVSYAMLAGIMMISLVSFWDDISSLPNKFRILVHLLSVTGLLYSVDAFQSWPLWVVPIAYIIIIGIINAYNFMDGINGITGLYSLMILLSLLYLNEVVLPFTESAFIICPAIACFVFLIFNFRKKAKCFAGDVGSVSIGFWIIALLLLVVIETNNLKYLLFLTVYGVDAVLTILHRLILKQNIFEAHRLHLYQILANENKINHLLIAAVYGITQLLINLFILTTDLNLLDYSLIFIIPLSLVYLVLKPKLMSRAL